MITRLANNISHKANTDGLSGYVKPMSESYINAVKNPNYQIEQEHERERKNNKWKIVTATSIVSVVALSLVLLQRGKIGSKFDKFRTFIENTLNEISQKEQVTKLEKFYIKNLNKLKNLLEKVKLVNNTASIKDVPITMGLERVGLKKPSKKITSVFEKMANKTLRKKYGKSEQALNELLEKLSHLDTSTLASKNPSELITIAGETKSLAEWLKLSAKYQKLTKDTFIRGFGEKARGERFAGLKNSFSDIRERFWNKVFKNKDFKELGNEFVLENLAKPAKKAHGKKIDRFRKIITRNATDNAELALKSLNGLKIDPNELKSYKLLNSLKSTVKSLGKTAQGTAEYETLLSKIAKTQTDLTASLQQSGTLANKEKLVNAINNICKNITNSKETGTIQKLLQIQKGLLSPEEYKKLEKTCNAAIKSLNKSTALEKGDFVDKIRDFSSGSAVTDVLFTGLTPIAGIGAALTMADDKKEKQETLLKLGVPLIGGIAVSLSCSAGLVPVGLAMVYGLGSSAGLKFIGDKLNDKLNEKDMINDLNKKTENNV